MLITDLEYIADTSKTNEVSNEVFKSFLLQQGSEHVDELVSALNEEISPKIDCTQCGNCCRSLMINIETKDTERLAAHLEITPGAFESKYVERSSGGSLAVMNRIPCPFLCENKCTVYEARPNECREFPGLHKPAFNQRLFATFMHYGRCPIVFNVVEELKRKMKFLL